MISAPLPISRIYLGATFTTAPALLDFRDQRRQVQQNDVPARVLRVDDLGSGPDIPRSSSLPRHPRSDSLGPRPDDPNT